MGVPLNLFRVALAALVLVSHASAGAQAPGDEHDLKAAYIYNFIRFVEWPGATGNGDIVVCVVGSKTHVTRIREGLEGKKIGDRSITVKSATAPAQVPGCEVLYVSGRNTQNARRFVGAVSRSKVLTITEVDRFPTSGGLINFFLDDQTVRFAVNADLLAETQFKLSSQMLQFGTMVSARNSGS